MRSNLNLPSYAFRFKTMEDTECIFDVFRKKYVKLTPEEWVRQNFARYLVEERAFPAGRIVVEKFLNYNNMSKRCDLLIYSENPDPIIMVECKAPGVKIKKEVFDQVAVYNMVFKVRYLLVTNGLTHYAAEVNFEKQEVRFLDEIPYYPDCL